MSTPSLDVAVDLQAKLCAALDRVSLQIGTDRQERREIWAGVDYIPDLIVSTAALPFAQSELMGPKTGFAWAVQAVRVNHLGASTDYVQVYRGKTAASAAPPYPALNTFLPMGATPFACPAWHPGRTGLVLKDGVGLVFNGTVTGLGNTAPLVIAIDVIQLTLAKLPYFLL